MNRPHVLLLGAVLTGCVRLADYDPEAHHGTTHEPETVEVLEGAGDMMFIVHAEAWGDFSADGADDLVVSVINGATQGSFRSARLMTLTRSSDAEPLRLVAVQ